MSLLAGGRCVHGSIVVAEHDWNVPGTMGWTSDEGWVTLSNPMTGGSDGGGYLKMALDPAPLIDPGSQWHALAKVQASSLFAGNWQGVQVAFNFWAEDVQPEYVQVRWASTNAVWRSTVFDSGSSSMSTQQWTSLVSPSLVSYLDWDYGSGSQQRFIDDLSAIDWIGVYIWRNTGMAQEYGLDEFRLMVPEPAEYMMIAAALVSSALSLRRRWAGRAAASA